MAVLTGWELPDIVRKWMGGASPETCIIGTKNRSENKAVPHGLGN